MPPENRVRLLRALIDKVVVDEDKGTDRVELIDLGAASRARGWPGWLGADAGLTRVTQLLTCSRSPPICRSR